MGRLKKHIKIHLDVAEINAAIEEVNKHRILEEKVEDDVLKRLAEIGRSVVEQEYALARDAYDRNINGFEVVVEKINNGYAIVARGEEVMFLEFGAGDATDSNHPFADNVSAEIRPGSWSEEHSQQFSTRGYWYYGGRVMNYIFPTRGMAHASAEMIARVTSEVGRIISK